jgi:MFS family permease
MTQASFEGEVMKRKRLILISLLLAAFVINLDTTIVNVALPTLVRELHASDSQLQWVVDAFNLLFAGSVLALGSLSDRFGRKGMLLAGLAVFGFASLAGGLTDSTGALIAARAVMGVGAAMVFPSTLSLISNVFTERRERAGDRLVGRDHWRGDRARTDRRWRPARGVRLAQHRLRDDSPGRHRRGPGRPLRPDLA